MTVAIWSRTEEIATVASLLRNDTSHNINSCVRMLSSRASGFGNIEYSLLTNTNPERERRALLKSYDVTLTLSPSLTLRVRYFKAFR